MKQAAMEPDVYQIVRLNDDESGRYYGCCVCGQGFLGRRLAVHLAVKEVEPACLHAPFFAGMQGLRRGSLRPVSVRQAPFLQPHICMTRPCSLRCSVCSARPGLPPGCKTCPRAAALVTGSCGTSQPVMAETNRLRARSPCKKSALTTVSLALVVRRKACNAILSGTRMLCFRHKKSTWENRFP